jgi:hypothetical protein
MELYPHLPIRFLWCSALATHSDNFTFENHSAVRKAMEVGHVPRETHNREGRIGIHAV